MVRLNRAYEVLSDPARRAAYDAQSGSRSSSRRRPFGNADSARSRSAPGSAAGANRASAGTPPHRRSDHQEPPEVEQGNSFGSRILAGLILVGAVLVIRLIVSGVLEGTDESPSTTPVRAVATPTPAAARLRATPFRAVASPTTLAERSQATPAVVHEAIAVIGDLGGGAALIRRLDGSFWIIEYVGQCSSLTYSSSVAVVRFGSPDAELVVRRSGGDERCRIVNRDSRIERATVSPIGGFGSSQAILARANDEEWEIEYGSGCLSLEVGDVVTGYIRSPGQFAGEGSGIIVLGPFDQRCRVQSSQRLEVVAAATPSPTPSAAPVRTAVTATPAVAQSATPSTAIPIPTQAATPPSPDAAPEVITVIGDLGGGSVLIRRLDGSFWIIERVGQCPSLTYSSSSVEIEGFGSPEAELVVRRSWSDDERCRIVSTNSRIEAATISQAGSRDSSRAVLERANGEQWELEYGAGCRALLTVRGTVTGYIRSPGEFAGDGSEIIVVDPYDQRCRIQSSQRSGLLAVNRQGL